MGIDRWMLASVLTGLLVLQSMPSNAEPRIGVAASTRPKAEAIADAAAQSQSLSAGSEIYVNQTVRTGNFGMADLVFIDSTNLGVGPSSEVRLEKFVYDPTGVGGTVGLNATRGTFRFVTGKQAKQAYVSTPHGMLRAHSTVEVIVNPNKRVAENECVTKIRLVEGEATYDVAKSGKRARLTQPNQVACISPSGEISYSMSSTSILSFSAEAPPPPPAFIPGTGGGTIPFTPPPVVSPTAPL